MKFGAVHLLRCCEEVVLMFKKNSRNSQKFGHEDQSSMPRTHIKAKQTNKQTKTQKQVCDCNPGSGKAETGRSLGITGQPQVPKAQREQLLRSRLYTFAWRGTHT